MVFSYTGGIFPNSTGGRFLVALVAQVVFFLYWWSMFLCVCVCVCSCVCAFVCEYHYCLHLHIKTYPIRSMGTVIPMTYVTGQPIVFVGTGHRDTSHSNPTQPHLVWIGQCFVPNIDCLVSVGYHFTSTDHFWLSSLGCTIYAMRQDRNRLGCHFD